MRAFLIPLAAALTLITSSCRCPDCPACPDTTAAAAKPCPTTSAPAPAPTPTTSAPPPGPDPATCAGVCAHMKTLGCAAAATTKEGHTCEEVCANVQASGVVKWNLACQAKATSCAVLDACK